MADNKVWVNTDGFIVIQYHGLQDYESIIRLRHDVAIETARLSEKGQPALILVDVTHIGKIASDARREAIEFIKQPFYDGMAVFGGNLFMKHLNNFVIAALGLGSRLRYFDSRDLATEWLNQKKQKA